MHHTTTLKHSHKWHNEQLQESIMIVIQWIREIIANKNALRRTFADAENRVKTFWSWIWCLHWFPISYCLQNSPPIIDHKVLVKVNCGIANSTCLRSFRVLITRMEQRNNPEEGWNFKWRNVFQAISGNVQYQSSKPIRNEALWQTFTGTRAVSICACIEQTGWSDTDLMFVPWWAQRTDSLRY